LELCWGVARGAGTPPPPRQNLERFVASDGAVVGPVEQIPRGVGAQSVRTRKDSNPAQVQTVRIPARLQGRITLDQSIGVQTTGLEEQLETGVIKMHQFPAQGIGELCSAQTMAVVLILVDPPRIMEECKERHHLRIGSVQVRDLSAVFKHAGPVDDSMVATHRKRIAGEDGSQDGGMVVHMA